MTLFQQFQWVLAIWTLVEGSLVLLIPGLSIRVSGWISKDLRSNLEAIPRKQLRQLGAIEAGFGLCLAAFLLWFQR